MVEFVEQYGVGVVVFQLGWIGYEYVVLFDIVVEFEEVIVVGFDDLDDFVFVVFFDQQMFFVYYLFFFVVLLVIVRCFGKSIVVQ